VRQSPLARLLSISQPICVLLKRSNRRLSSKFHRSSLPNHKPSSQPPNRRPSRPKLRSLLSDLRHLNPPITPFCCWFKATTNPGACALAYGGRKGWTGTDIRLSRWNPPTWPGKVQPILGLTTRRILRLAPRFRSV
jgi:hypothetical protein